MTATMRAAVVDRPGPPEVLQIRELPIPQPDAGQVLIRVRAFGLNRSELHFRQGLATSGTFPRVPGIEAAGIVAAAPGGELAVGTQVVTMMGGMGRAFDGGYAEYVLVPAAQVMSFHSDLPWDQLGAVPEMLQTAYGSLTVGLQASPGQSLLIRGGTSSIGLALTVLAKQQDMTVYATTRREQARTQLERLGVDHVLLDDGDDLRSDQRPRPDRRRRRCRAGRRERPARTRCEPSGPAARSASPGCCRTSGRSRSSTRWTGCPTASG